MRLIISLAIVVIAFMGNFSYGADQSLSKNARYFEHILDLMSGFEFNSAESYPNRKDDAEKIIFAAIDFAYRDNYDKIENDNDKHQSNSPDIYRIIPQQLVEEALCKYFGYTPQDTDALKAASQKSLLPNGFYAMDAYDPSFTSHSINKIEMLNNDLVRVSGDTEYEDSNFKALFKKIKCNSKTHWKLIKYINQTRPE